ncbi:MAG: Ig-like domain-containing protein [Clostridiales bacterium]|nr:Ig-like domain-containing protein [Clostridiales bacterium]
MKTKKEEQNQIKCKNCGGVYDASESTCPHCGEETSSNLDAAGEGPLEMTKYGGGYQSGGGFSRLVTVLLAALLLILAVALVIYGVNVAGEIAAQRQDTDSSLSSTASESQSGGDLAAEPDESLTEPDESQTASGESDPEPEVSSEAEPEVVAATGLTLSKTQVSLEEGGSARLEATVSPEDWSGTVTWSSSNAGVATVDSSGTVTYVASGTCTITAAADDQTATCTVTCAEPVDTSVATGISLNYTDITLNSLGDAASLVATVTPSGWEGTVSWSSSDESVATVDSTGYVLYVSGGTCTITARAGDLTASCRVHCRTTDTGSSGSDTGSSGGDTGSSGGDTGSSGTGTGSSSSLTLDNTDITLNSVGDGITLTVTGGNGTYTWSSSNTAVATVTTGGSVYAQGSGTCTITVTSGGSSASCVVRVR